MSGVFDVVVIGAGPGGYVAAIHGAQLGLRVALVERDARLGGTCLLRGCIPTKALLESAALYDRVGRAGRFGVRVEGFSLDFEGVHRAKDQVVDANAKGVSFLLEKYGVEVVHGHGQLQGKDTVLVRAAEGGERTLQARNILLATGSRCGALPFIALDHEVVVNSDDMLAAKTLPKRLTVIGAGAVGVEFASIFARFGTAVELIEVAERIVPLEDEEISGALEHAFRRQKIAVYTNTRVQSVTRDGAEARVEVRLPDGTTKSWMTDRVLVAVGRAPVTDGLGLDEAGVLVDARGFVVVDEWCRTRQAGVFAIGDIIATPQLAHVASHEGTLVMDQIAQIAGREVQPLRYEHVPNCIYCHPEVASVGLTEKQARSAGYDVRTATFPFKASGKAKIAQETAGLIKMVAEAGYNELLGVHIVGHHATELIAEAVAALRLESTVEELVHTIHPHPTLSEVMGEVAHGLFFGQPLHY